MCAAQADDGTAGLLPWYSPSVSLQVCVSPLHAKDHGGILSRVRARGPGPAAGTLRAILPLRRQGAFGAVSSWPVLFQMSSSCFLKNLLCCQNYIFLIRVYSRLQCPSHSCSMIKKSEGNYHQKQQHFENLNRVVQYCENIQDCRVSRSAFAIVSAIVLNSILLRHSGSNNSAIWVRRTLTL